MKRKTLIIGASVVAAGAAGATAGGVTCARAVEATNRDKTRAKIARFMAQRLLQSSDILSGCEELFCPSSAYALFHCC